MVAEHDIVVTFTQPVLTADRVRTPFHAQLNPGQSRTGDLSVWFDRDPSRRVSVVVSMMSRPDDQLELEGADIRDVMNHVRIALAAMWTEMYADDDDTESAPRPGR